MYISGFLGADATAYSCTSSICYGVGSANDAAVRAFQSAVNRYAGLAGFSVFTADGKIGSTTLSALKKVANYLPSSSAAKIGAINAAISIQTAAAAATSGSLTSLLNAFIGGAAPTAPVAKPSTPAPTTSTLPASQVPDVWANAAASAGSSGSNTKWYALGGLVMAGVAYLAYRNYKEAAH